MKTTYLLTILLLTLGFLPAHGAINTRPLSGIGLLLVRTFPTPNDARTLQLTLYLEPELGRLTEVDTAELPSLTTVIKTKTDEYPILVSRRQGEWLKIAYDEAGREGWLRLEPYWDYQPWELLLKGKPVRLLAGLKKGYYQLYSAPNSKASRLETLNKQRQLRIIEVQGDWALVIVDLAGSGWLRWRDDDGRFLISIEERLSDNKR